MTTRLNCYVYPRSVINREGMGTIEHCGSSPQIPAPNATNVDGIS